MSMSNKKLLIEQKFKDEKIETMVVAYLLKKDASMVTLVEPIWFSSVVLQNLIIILKDVRTSLLSDTVIRELKTRKMIGKNETAIYKEVLEEVYKTPVSKISKKNFQVNVDIVIEMYEWRSIVNGVQNIVKGALNDTMDVDRAKRLMKELGTGVRLAAAVESGDYIHGFEDRLSVLMKKKKLWESGKEAGIPTGIRVFDHVCGGLMNGEFGVIAGQPSVGKSALLSAFALHAYKSGYNVLYVTGEMTKNDVEFRMDSDVASVPATKFRLGNISTDEIARWRKAIEREIDLHDSFLEVVSFPKDFTTGDIEGHIHQIWDSKEKFVDLVCLDYINLMRPVISKRNEGMKDWKAQADAVWDVKAMCASLNICLWTANQVKDEAHDVDVLSLDDLKYSRAISETAPIVVGLVRTHDEEAEHVLELQVMKMRNAPLMNRSIVLKPNLEYMRIHEEVLPREKDFRLIEPDTVKKKAPRKVQMEQRMQRASRRTK